MSSDPSPSKALAISSRSDRNRTRGHARRNQMLARERIAALGEMSAGFAHDLRNILGVIGSALNLAERFREDRGKLDSALDAAREGLQRGANLVSRLLAFGQPGEREIEARDINALLQRIEPFLAYAAGPKVDLRFAPGADLPECEVDAAGFGAALLNLVTNARDAMPTGGTVRIATNLIRMMESSDDDDALAVLLRVVDDGPGMTRAVRDQIFDPWFTTKSETGTGLGMPQVAAFMRASGGCVSVNSEPGVGTSVDLYFPVSCAPGLVGSALWNRLDRETSCRPNLSVPPAGH